MHPTLTYKTVPPIPPEKPKLHYSPTLSLLFELAKERDLGELITATMSSRTELIRACDIINGYVDQIRLQASSARHREKQKEFSRVPNENHRWLRALIDDCFTGNEHLYFAYMDLGYGPTINAKPAKFYAQAKANGRALRDHLDNGEKWPSTILGYGLNLRYLPYNGYHYRLLVICQPKEKESPALITTALEKEWENVTAQTGVVFNHLFKVRDRPLEKIAREDDAARKELEKKLYFLTQLDSLVRLKLAPKDRHFFRGEKRG
jgi:hypothetical protein